MSKPANANAPCISCCCFDLETTSLNADFGILLCAVIKPAGGKEVVIRADEADKKRWQTTRSDDSVTVQRTIAELAKHDIWVAHNGAKFDVPFLRTRAIRWGLNAVPAGKLIDPLQLARNKLRVSYNSLARIADLLGCNSKTEVKSEHWLQASLDGNKGAMDYIVKHCVEDVVTLEKVVMALKAYSTNYNSYGSGF